jgi:hypothetical protein
MMFLAKPTQYRLLRTFLYTANLLLGTVGYTSSALDSHLRTTLKLATFSSGAMGAAQAGLFDVFGASRVGASFTLRAVGDAKSTLDDAVRTPVDSAFTPCRSG